MEKFGEIEFISLQDECPVGLVLRQQEHGVVLEQYFDTKGVRVDIVHEFDEELNLNNQKDLEDCLTVARLYEPDLDVLIHIDKGVDPKGEAERKKAREDYIRRIVEHNRRHSYAFGP